MFEKTQIHTSTTDIPYSFSNLTPFLGTLLENICVTCGNLCSTHRSIKTNHTLKHGYFVRGTQVTQIKNNKRQSKKHLT